MKQMLICLVELVGKIGIKLTYQVSSIVEEISRMIIIPLTKNKHKVRTHNILALEANR